MPSRGKHSFATASHSLGRFEVSKQYTAYPSSLCLCWTLKASSGVPQASFASLGSHGTSLAKDRADLFVRFWWWNPMSSAGYSQVRTSWNMFAFSMIVGYSNEYATHIRAFVVLNSGCILEQAIALETHEFRLNLGTGDSVGNERIFIQFCIFFLLWQCSRPRSNSKASARCCIGLEQKKIRAESWNRW